MTDVYRRLAPYYFQTAWIVRNQAQAERRFEQVMGIPEWLRFDVTLREGCSYRGGPSDTGRLHVRDRDRADNHAIALEPNGAQQRDNAVESDLERDNVLPRHSPRTGRTPRVVSRGAIEHEAVLERARLDGQALWRREKPRHLVRAAAADIVGTPAHVLNRTIEPRYSDAQAWGEGEVWAARQASFLRAGVDDRGAGIATTDRANAFVRESISRLKNSK